jgi:hypothetical protein
VIACEDRPGLQAAGHGLPPAQRGVQRQAKENGRRAQVGSRVCRLGPLRQLGSFERRLGAAGDLVADAVRVIRGQLGLLPAKTS